MMRRRAFLAGAGALALGRHTASAQELRRLAVVGSSGFPTAALAADGHPRFRAFFAALEQLGWEEGRNLTIDRWSFDGRAGSEYADLARQIAASRPDAIFVTASVQAKLIMDATAAIGSFTPIVFYAGDPIGYGLGQSLARPGGNATGFSSGSGRDIDVKRLQFLNDIVPWAERIVYFVIPQTQARFEAPYAEAAEKLNVSLIPVVLELPIDEPTIRRAYDSAASLQAQALEFTPVTPFLQHAALIGALALAAHLPASAPWKELVEAGLLLSYAPDRPAIYRRAAGYVDRVLKGEDPAAMPIQQPTEFDFVINLKTARALGIEIPPKLLILATENIE